MCERWSSGANFLWNVQQDGQCGEFFPHRAGLLTNFECVAVDVVLFRRSFDGSM
jgi:hypothetical protein